jgi:hypothetical protein
MSTNAKQPTDCILIKTDVMETQHVVTELVPTSAHVMKDSPGMAQHALEIVKLAISIFPLSPTRVFNQERFQEAVSIRY